MKLHEIDLAMVKAHARVTGDWEDGLIEGVYMPAAMQHILAYTGMTAAEADAREDIPLAYLALVTHLIDNRGLMEDAGHLSDVMASILGKYCRHMLAGETGLGN